jgi:alpha-tubulin suppressor-like RCC1 family protein
LDIAAGKYHTLALKIDGTVAAFGAGTTATTTSPKYGQSIVPANLGICTKIAAGGYHSLAIKGGDTISGWGAGTTNNSISPNYGQSIPPTPNVDWLEISAGEFHTVAIQNNAALLPCAGDFNNDGRRDGLDMTSLLSGWGTPNGDCNGDGTTDGSDMTLLLSGWGFCP